MELSRVYTWLRLLAYLFLIICICLLFYYQLIILKFVRERNQTLSMVYTLLNALLFGMYLNALGIDTTNEYIKYVFFIAVIILMLFSVNEFGIRIELRQSIIDEFWQYFRIGRPLRYTFIQTNSEKVIIFFSLNLILLIVLYGISFIFEHEVN